MYGDNLLVVASQAKALAGYSYNVATFALIHFGFLQLATVWDEPVPADAVSRIEDQLIRACEEAILDPTPHAVEKLARELFSAVTHLDL